MTARWWVTAALALVVTTGARAQLFGLPGTSAEGGGLGGLVSRARETLAVGAYLAGLPVPEGDPSDFQWSAEDRDGALGLLAPRARLRPHRPRPVVPETLRLPWPASEGVAAAADPELEMPRGMTYANWDFGIPGMVDLSIDVSFHRTPRAAPGEGIYLQLYDADIGATGQYFGFQFRERDGETVTQVIWSQFGSRDLERLDEEPEGYHEEADYEGDFVSLRYPYEFGRGTYTVHVSLDALAPEGAWYLMRIYDHGAGSWTRIGRMRFPYAKGKLPTIQDGGGTWQEVFAGVQRPSEVTPFHLSIGGVYTAGRTVAPRTARTHYDADIANSDISWDPAGRRLHMRFGGRTRRRTPEGTIPLKGRKLEASRPRS